MTISPAPSRSGEIIGKGEDAMMLAGKAQEAPSSLSGQGLVEYALILVLVAIVVIAALLLLGPVIGNAFSTVNNSLINL
jgi:pilus assembly protein Flp/PilA